MDKTLLLVKLDANYCDYLRQYDNKVHIIMVVKS